MQYSYYARNYEQDNIYYTRLMLIQRLNFDYNKSVQRYTYFMDAYLGITL